MFTNLYYRYVIKLRTRSIFVNGFEDETKLEKHSFWDFVTFTNQIWSFSFLCKKLYISEEVICKEFEIGSFTKIAVG